MTNALPTPDPSDARALVAESILRLTRRALLAPDLAAAVIPTLEELTARTAAVGSAYFQLNDRAVAYQAKAAAGHLPDGEAMRSILTHGLPLDTPLLRALERSDLPLFFDDTRHAPAAAGFPELGVSSLAAAPVRDPHRQLIGAFLMHTFTPHAWSTAEAELFTAVAGTLAALTARLAAEEAAVAAREAALRALGLGLEYKDRETRGHTDRVTALAERVGVALHFSPQDLRALRWGAYLHDVGKLSIPDAVLLKPGRLNAEEWRVMQGHVREGERFAEALGFLPDAALAIIAGHHERWDGTGYPRATRGETTPLPARLFAVCDVFDALTHERPYKPAWTVTAATQEIRALAGRHFDPAVTTVILDLLTWTTPDEPAPPA